MKKTNLSHLPYLLGYVGFQAYLSTCIKSGLKNQMEIEESYIRLCSVAGKEKASVIMEEIKAKLKTLPVSGYPYIKNELDKAYNDIIQNNNVK